jgi:hypothetical protein
MVWQEVLARCIFLSCCGIIHRMDATRLVLDTYDTFVKVYSAFCRKQYVTVKVRLIPQRGKSNPETPKEIAFSILNESGPDIVVQEAWFLTSYRRRVFAQSIDSKMPINVRSKDRTTHFLPFDELKSALNERIKETITHAVVFDKNQHQYQSRIDETLEKELAK